MMEMNMEKYVDNLRDYLLEIKELCLNVEEYNVTPYEYMMRDDATIQEKIEKIVDRLYEKLDKMHFVLRFVTTDNKDDDNMVMDLKDVVKRTKHLLEYTLMNGAYDDLSEDGEKIWQKISREIRMCDDKLIEKLNIIG